METVRKITLAGKEWEIPTLVVRHTKVIDPIIMRLAPVFSSWKSPNLVNMPALTPEQYDSLLLMVFTALSAKYKDLKIEEFHDMPITSYELIGAFPIIAYQTGFYVEHPQGDPQPGEDHAS